MACWKHEFRICHIFPRNTKCRSCLAALRKIGCLFPLSGLIFVLEKKRGGVSEHEIGEYDYTGLVFFSSLDPLCLGVPFFISVV